MMSILGSIGTTKLFNVNCSKGHCISHVITQSPTYCSPYKKSKDYNPCVHWYKYTGELESRPLEEALVELSPVIEFSKRDNDFTIAPRPHVCMFMEAEEMDLIRPYAFTKERIRHEVLCFYVNGVPNCAAVVHLTYASRSMVTIPGNTSLMELTLLMDLKNGIILR